MNLIAISLLITALISFAAFHFMVLEYHSSPPGEAHDVGWEIWPLLYEFIKEADFSELRGMIAAACFLCATLLVVLCPFLMPVLKSSRLVWWVVVISAGLATCGFGGVLTIDLLDPANSFGPGVPCLLAAFALNFLGLLFVRREGASSSPGWETP